MQTLCTVQSVVSWLCGMVSDMRLIDADKLMEYVKGRKTRNYPKGELEWTIEQLPTIEAVPAVHGRWLIKEDESCFATWDYCSVCGFTMGFAGSSHYAKFCPNCGAKMKE